MIHFFSADVLTATVHPRNWNTWNSDLCADFSDTTSEFLATITNSKTISGHAFPTSTMTTKEVGLDSQHPRSTAILTCFMTMKRNIQHATEEAWTNNQTHTITLPTHIKLLFKNWKTSTSPIFQLFQNITKTSRAYASKTQCKTETTYFCSSHQSTDAKNKSKQWYQKV